MTGKPVTAVGKPAQIGFHTRPEGNGLEGADRIEALGAGPEWPANFPDSKTTKPAARPRYTDKMKNKPATPLESMTDAELENELERRRIIREMIQHRIYCGELDTTDADGVETMASHA